MSRADVIDREECVGAFTDASGQVDERRWEVLVNTHFDNIFNAMLATFEVLAPSVPSIQAAWV